MHIFFFAAPLLAQESDLLKSIATLAASAGNTFVLNTLAEHGVSLPALEGIDYYRSADALERLETVGIGKKQAEAIKEGNSVLLEKITQRKEKIKELIARRRFESAYEKITELENPDEKGKKTSVEVGEKIIKKLIEDMWEEREEALRDGGILARFKIEPDNFLNKGERVLRPPRNCSLANLEETYTTARITNPWLCFLEVCIEQACKLYQQAYNPKEPGRSNDCQALKTLTHILILNPVLFSKWLEIHRITAEEAPFYSALSQILISKPQGDFAKDKREKIRGVLQDIDSQLTALTAIKAAEAAAIAPPAGPTAAPIADLEVRRAAAAATVTPAAVAAGAEDGFFAKARKLADDAKRKITELTAKKTGPEAGSVNAMGKGS